MVELQGIHYPIVSIPKLCGAAEREKSPPRLA
jgi:hypothetical protein